MNKNKFFFIGFNVLNVLDILTTLYGLKILGFYEHNPVMKYVLDIDYLLFTVVKLLVGFYASYYFFYSKSKTKYRFEWGIFVCIVYLIIVSRNIIAILQAS